MSDDDDDVLGIDLDAWQAPPAPAGIADGVIARMREEVTQVTQVGVAPVEQTAPRTPRRWWLAGGVAAAIVAATLGTFALTRSGPPKNARGITAGDRAAHIALGASSADVDPNTVVSWRREGERITAQQAGGIAAWRVDEDDTLTIETGLGSIEATNASLRVEVKMLDERKTIALSAITAAAVAAVTIVVYEGVVRVNADGATTTVAPGTAYQIRAKGDNTIVQDQEAVGAAPIDDLNAELDRLRAEIAAKAAERELLVKRINGLLPENVDKNEVQNKMKGLADQLAGCREDFAGKLVVNVKVRDDGTVEDVDVTPDAKPNACISRVVKTVTFSPTKRGVTFTYPLVFTQPKNFDLSANPYVKKDSCDAEALRQRGNDLFASNLPAEALDLYERAYACKPDPMLLKFMLAAACKAKLTHEAKQLWGKLGQAQRDQVLPICAANGIFADDFNTGQLRVNNPAKPTKILVDGKEVGMAPVTMDLTPGKHKVMFVIGADRHTFSVLIKAGETTVLSKDIE